MERVLLYEDLLVLILACPGIDKRALARSARVCRTWFEPAVQKLWRSPSVLFLFKLLPGDHSNEVFLSDMVFEARVDTDWIRFDIYAKHVRRLLVEFDENFSCIHEVLSMQGYTKSLKCLVPNIEELQIDCGPYTLDSLFFIHEDLRELSVNHMEMFSDFYNTFAYIIPRAPNLVSLTLSCTYEQSHQLLFDNDFVFALRELKLLETLYIDGFNLSPDAILCLASLRRLRELTLFACSSPCDFEFGDPDQTLVTLAGKQEEPFPCMKEIRMDSHMITFLYFLSWGFSLPRIEKLDVSIRDGKTEVSRQRCFEGLVANLSNLSYLHLSFSGLSDQSVLRFTSFRILSDLRRLESFYVESSAQLIVNDNELDDLIQDWPSLLSFGLISERDRQIPRLTLLCFVSFANYCKNIRTISLCVDATQDTKVPWFTPAMRNLQEIYFSLSPISDPDMVARELSYICPLTCQISACDMSSDGDLFERYGRDWIQVSRLLESKRVEMDKILQGSLSNNTILSSREDYDDKLGTKWEYMEESIRRDLARLRMQS